MASNQDVIEEFEGCEPADIYVDKTFDTWRKTENQGNMHEFEERVGPVRIFDASASALNYFQCFYTEEVFTSITNFTNLNVTRKRDADPRHKGVWNDVTVPEMKAFYGLVILMSIMQF